MNDHKLFYCLCSRYSQADQWEVYLGLHAQSETSKSTLKSVKRIISHPQYDHLSYDNDIALMELDSPVTLNQNIWPICLPEPTHDFPAGKAVWITGWGKLREEIGKRHDTSTWQINQLKNKTVLEMSLKHCAWNTYRSISRVYWLLVDCYSLIIQVHIKQSRVSKLLTCSQHDMIYFYCTNPTFVANVRETEWLVSKESAFSMLQNLLHQCCRRLRCVSLTAPCAAGWWMMG